MCILQGTQENEDKQHLHVRILFKQTVEPLGFGAPTQ